MFYEGSDLAQDAFPSGRDEFRNPILPGFHPDPSILRAGSDDYIVNSSFGWLPGLPIYHSRDVRGTVPLVNALQKHAMTQTRLGIPMLMYEEGLHGYAALDATSFPQSIALASSLDPGLIREINVVIGREIRARGVSLALSPVVDVARDPRWGQIVRPTLI